MTRAHEESEKYKEYKIRIDRALVDGRISSNELRELTTGPDAIPLEFIRTNHGSAISEADIAAIEPVNLPKIEDFLDRLLKELTEETVIDSNLYPLGLLERIEDTDNYSYSQNRLNEILTVAKTISDEDKQNKFIDDLAKLAGFNSYQCSLIREAIAANQSNFDEEQLEFLRIDRFQNFQRRFYLQQLTDFPDRAIAPPSYISEEDFREKIDQIKHNAKAIVDNINSYKATSDHAERITFGQNAEDFLYVLRIQVLELEKMGVVLPDLSVDQVTKKLEQLQSVLIPLERQQNNNEAEVQRDLFRIFDDANRFPPKIKEEYLRNVLQEFKFTDQQITVFIAQENFDMDALNLTSKQIERIRRCEYLPFELDYERNRDGSPKIEPRQPEVDRAEESQVQVSIKGGYAKRLNELQPRSERIKQPAIKQIASEIVKNGVLDHDYNETRNVTEHKNSRGEPVVLEIQADKGLQFQVMSPPNDRIRTITIPHRDPATGELDYEHYDVIEFNRKGDPIGHASSGDMRNSQLDQDWLTAFKAKINQRGAKIAVGNPDIEEEHDPRALRNGHDDRASLSEITGRIPPPPPLTSKGDGRTPPPPLTSQRNGGTQPPGMQTSEQGDGKVPPPPPPPLQGDRKTSRAQSQGKSRDGNNGLDGSSDLDSANPSEAKRKGKVPPSLGGDGLHGGSRDGDEENLYQRQRKGLRSTANRDKDDETQSVISAETDFSAFTDDQIRQIDIAKLSAQELTRLPLEKLTNTQLQSIFDTREPIDFRFRQQASKLRVENIHREESERSAKQRAAIVAGQAVGAGIFEENGTTTYSTPTRQPGSKKTKRK